MLISQKVTYVWINNLSKISSEASNKVEISRCQFQLFISHAGLVLNSWEAWAAQDTDLGRHLGMKTVGMPGSKLGSCRRHSLAVFAPAHLPLA